MAILSDLLGFGHHTCARGSTVERPFLEDLARALGDTNPRSARNKDALIVRAITLADGKAPANPRPYLSSGGTVKDKTLDRIIDAVLANGLGVPPQDAVAARVAADLDTAKRPDADEAFDALNLSDERKASLRLVVDRPGQRKFRDAVLAAYPGCAITGCLEASVLDAAHIRPYKGPRTNVVRNGICLRTDLHRLWDRGLLAVHEVSRRVLLHPQVTDTAYVVLAGTPVGTPAKPEQWPDPEALRLQRQWCGL